MTKRPTIIKLTNAYLCANCDVIGDSAVLCPTCASGTGIMALVSLLNRTQKEESCTQPTDKQTPKPS